MTSIQSNVVNLHGYSNYLTATSFLLHARDVHECTMHKLHERMCIMNSWGTRSELKAPSDYSKHKRASQVLTKASLLKTMHCRIVMENAGCQMLYRLVVTITRLCNTHSLVECSHVKTMLRQSEALE